jgi:hypothetical protein
MMGSAQLLERKRGTFIVPEEAAINALRVKMVEYDTLKCPICKRYVSDPKDLREHRLREHKGPTKEI